MSLTPYLHLEVTLEGAGEGTTVPLPPATSHHLRRVLRLRDGAAVVVADGRGGEARASLTADGLKLDAAPQRRRPRRPRLVLAQALPKARKLDEVLRQAVELGVDEVRVLETERCVARLEEERLESARERWAGVVRAACEQARRPDRPAVQGPIRLDHLGRDEEVLLLAHPGSPALPSVADELVGAATIVLAVGPEGGFTDTELADAVAGGALVVGLGPDVLRTEHAGAAGLAVLAAGVGRWGSEPDATPC
ncbi:MAG: RsmE family RNA methyltransferase [Nitriliruptoraceae bacterium]